MHPQLEHLIILNDMDMMIKELSNGDVASEFKELGFRMKPGEKLMEDREKIRSQVEPDLLKQYDKLYNHYGRAIVPISSNVCYGCFMQLPVYFVSSAKKNDDVLGCPKCGRFLYWV
ncbi:zinc ribbon domain-containing protein [Thermodesulfobacteriota bacterium]